MNGKRIVERKKEERQGERGGRDQKKEGKTINASRGLRGGEKKKRREKKKKKKSSPQN